MQVGGDGRLGQLTYCTNIHPGESWPEVSASLAQNLPAIRTELAADQSFGIGLRLSAEAAAGLSEPAALADFQRFLADGDYYVFTINGFPYGAFHGRRVKEDAYRPDWSEPPRLAYTNRLADLLVELLPDGRPGSISTVPGTFKPWAAGREDAIAAQLIAHVAHLVDLQRRTDNILVLALEPEPYCLLETIEETVAFFEQRLFSAAAVGQLAGLTGQSRAAAAEALRRHLGVCYDVCHAAVEFEDPRASITKLRDAGIAIAKLQLSSALRIASVEPQIIDQLRPFNEPVYLHQVVEAQDGRLRRYLDLPEALGNVESAAGAEWRIHFHVPIFIEELKDFSTTQAFLRDVLALHRQEPISDHLEVETYTWDVLPEQYRGVAVSRAIARELSWVLGQLRA